MYKRMFTAILVAALLALGAAAVVSAEQTVDYNAVYEAAAQMTAENQLSGGTVSAACPYCGTEAQWEELTAIAKTSHIKENKHFYLSQDLNNSDFYYFYSNVCLHLNGYSITSSARAVYVERGAVLNIMGDGSITGKGLANTTCDRGALDVVGTLNLCGGIYQHANKYPVIAVRGSQECSLNIYDGTQIQGTKSYGGSSVRIRSSQVCVYGGTVTGGYSTGGNGGNFYVDGTIKETRLNIYGGTVQQGIAALGGNIYAAGEFASVNISGGTVVDGTTYVEKEIRSLTLSGAPVIDTLNLSSGKKATLEELTENAQIAVVANGVFTESNDRISDYAPCFKSPNELVKLSVQDGALSAAIDTTADSQAPICDGKTLKILAITSSFGLNTTELLYDVAVAEGIEEVVVGRLYASGCTLKEHVSNAANHTGAYWYTKFTDEGKVSLYDTALLYGLQDEDWDIIFVQQSAEQTGQLNTYLDYADTLMDYIHANKTNPNAKFVWNMTWAFQSDNTRKTFLETFRGSQMFMHNKIIQAMQEKVLTRSDFHAMIPTGAAVQNARTSFFGDTLTKDTLHLNNLGRVIAGYTVYATVMDCDLTQINVGAVKSYDLTTPLTLSESDKQVIIEAVNAARANPFAVTQSTYTEAHYNSIHTAAQKMTDDQVFASGQVVSAACPYCGDTVQWQPVTNDSEKKLGVTDAGRGHYYLNGDLTISSTYFYVPTLDSGTARICLHLNGHSIVNAGKRALWVAVNNTLNIMGDGVISGVGEGASASDYRGAALDVNGTVNLFGGTVQHASAIPAVIMRSAKARINLYDGAQILGNSSYSGSSVYLHTAGSVFNMYGGRIADGYSNKGGNIALHANVTFNLYGGVVENGTATVFGGNLFAQYGTVNLYGGLVTGGSVTNSSTSYGRGGNIALVGLSTATSRPVFKMTGGTIGGEGAAVAGYASTGGGNLYVAYSEALIGGENAVISHGTGDKYGGNIMVSADAYVTLNAGTVTGGNSNLGGNVYMAGTSSHFTINGGTLSDGVAKTSGGNVYANNGYFTASGGTLSGGTAVNGGNLYLRVGSAAADNVSVLDFDPQTAAAAPVISGGSLYLSGNVALGDFSVTDAEKLDVKVTSSAKLTVRTTFTGELYAALPDALLGEPVCGSPVVNASAEGAFAGKIYLCGDYGMPYLYGVDGDSALYVAGAALVKADGSKIWYNDNAAAMAAYSSDVHHIQAGPGVLTLSGDEYTVDLAGQTVNLTGTGSVTCFDSANDTYESCGSATVDGVQLVNGFVTDIGGKTYCTVLEDAVYSFHRLEAEITGVSLRPSNAGLYFTGKWTCDETLASRMDGFGIVVSLHNMPGADFATDPEEDNLWSTFSADAFASGVQKTGVMIEGILKDTDDQRIKMNPVYGKMPICAAAYLVIDGNTYVSAGVSVSLHDVLMQIDAQIDQFPQYARTMQDFLAYWKGFGLTGEQWDFGFELEQT